MRLAIIGSRSFKSLNYMEKTLEIYFPGDIDEIISGGAIGADKCGKDYAEIQGIPYRAFPADWDQYGKSAGYIRNKQIVDAADVVAAYWDGSSPGSRHTINIANTAKKPVLIFLYPKRQIFTLNWESQMKGLLNDHTRV